MERFALSFKLFGFPIVIQPSFWLIAILGGANQLDYPVLIVTWVVTLTLSVLWHELGHALAFRLFGRKSHIELYSFGGLTYSEDKQGLKSLSTRQSVLVSFAGPAAGLLMGGVVLLALNLTGYRPTDRLVHVAISDFLFINITWSFVNLLPMLPLDGGNIVNALLDKWMGKVGTLYAIGLSVVVALIVAGLAHHYHFSLAAMFALVFALDNGRRWKEHRKYLADEPIREKYLEAYQHYSKAEWAEAEKGAENVLKLASQDMWKYHTLILLCFSRLKQNNADGAWQALREIHPDELDEPTILSLENYFFELKSEETARKLAELRFQRTRNPGAAYNVACAYARMNQPQEAMEWLKQAKEAGFEDMTALREDKDLEHIRSLAEFENLWK